MRNIEESEGMAGREVSLGQVCAKVLAESRDVCSVEDLICQYDYVVCSKS